MFCSKCGTQVSDDATFCFKCGEKLSTNSTAEIIHTPNQAVRPIVNMNKSEIREYLEHAKTLEVSRYTLNTAIQRLQEKIDGLGIKKNFGQSEGNKEHVVRIATVIWAIGVIFSMSLGALISNVGFIERFIENIGFIELFIRMLLTPLPLALVGGIISYFAIKNNHKKAYLQKVENDNARVEVEKKQILALKEQQNELRTEVDKVEKLMEKLYSANVIYPKYRELVPIVTMWEYIDSGRCTELLGANGAYNLYESESRQDIIISNLAQAVSMLAEIRDTQYALYEAIQESNRIAERVYMQSERILESNKNIERNSEIASYNAKIAAQNSTISAYIDFCRF